ncbi:hypothetical protein IF1G_01489 [Cordyceps javanica]|uniref:Uncharacterized protein n=1 Tax=Cordyceps javanica TaxID=43265 RepID=A0A545WAP1_9HYPO|nr:hypothetical protein IF1G_01489 [Cordyceps javanica]TQW11053.1 hypothetical protein IF2G_01995 [Cordyceps javanica]
MSVPRILRNRMNETTLRECRFVNQTPGYRRQPAYLRFDYSKRNESASLVLLEAALSFTLCRQFLETPYFFIKYGRGLEEVEGTLAKTSMETSVDWRVNTLKSLGKNASLDPKVATEMAHRFVEDFGFLLIEMDKTAFTDLVELFIQFAEIALKLWSTKTHIVVSYPTEIWERGFPVGNPYVECEPGLVTTLGEQLNGRPVGVVLRPCIVSQPIQTAGHEPSQVVWSKAMVWLSSATRKKKSKH